MTPRTTSSPLTTLRKSGSVVLSLGLPLVLSLVLSLVGAGCGSGDGVDPYESETTRAIREKVRADMEVDRLQRYGKRLASLNAAVEASPTATRLAAVVEKDDGASSGGAGATAFDRGKAIYAQNCSSCHGMSGAGDGPVAASLVPKPARHDDGAYMNALSNDHLLRVIKQGGAAVGKSPMMAAWGSTMSDDQIRDVIVFLRSLADPPYTGPNP